ncbi:transcriptional regulator [Streptomyces sp. NPDC026659]|uniref:transcriptional regulator n=1 Tax=Streptomyces sp. NPDC026659 TaxID=3155123 RepID=UPI0033E822F5
MGRPPLDKQPNTLLAYWMDQCGMSRNRLARMVTQRGVQQGITGLATDESRVRAWLKGSTPRDPVPRLIREILSAASDKDLTYADLGLPGESGQTGIRSPWTRPAAIAALSQIIRSELMLPELPDTRTEADAATALTGQSLLDPLQEWALSHPDDTTSQSPPGRHIGMSEVEGIRAITNSFRNLDNAHGGVLSRAAVLAQANSVVGMLKNSTYTEIVGQALWSAAADLAGVAGWMSFDAGRHKAAQKTFVSALHAAAEANDKRIGAHILQCMARQMSHLGHPEDALDLVALAQYGARRHLTPATTSMLAALESRFQAILGRTAESEGAAGRAMEAFERVNPDVEEAHMAFFDLPELHATLGMAHQIAAKHVDGRARISHVRRSTDLVSAALAVRPVHRQRSMAFDHLGLARTHLADGEVHGAAEETARCLELLGAVQSRRVHDRLGELYVEATPFADTAPGRELRERVREEVLASR